MSGQMVHATAVSINGEGVLLVGPSGSGKSDLALRLIDRGATLVSDDAVELTAGDGHLMLTGAPNITGKIEIRGIGICLADAISSAPLRLVVELVQTVERLPSSDHTIDMAGFDKA
jgi:HPr kinase/phosphorylase